MEVQVLSPAQRSCAEMKPAAMGYIAAVRYGLCDLILPAIAIATSRTNISTKRICPIFMTPSLVGGSMCDHTTDVVESPTRSESFCNFAKCLNKLLQFTADIDGVVFGADKDPTL